MSEGSGSQRYCGNCGAEVRSGTSFCVSCGQQVAGNEEDKIIPERDQTDTGFNEETRRSKDESRRREERESERIVFRYQSERNQNPQPQGASVGCAWALALCGSIFVVYLIMAGISGLPLGSIDQLVVVIFVFAFLGGILYVGWNLDKIFPHWWD